MKVLIILAVVGAAFALPHVFIADTPEVQAERQRFFQLYNTAAAAAAAAPDDNQIPHQASHSHSTFRAAPQTTAWQGPLAATIPAGVSGALTQVQDTPDVIAARQAFERAFQAQVRATAPQQHQQQQQASFSSPHSSFHQAAPVQQKWTGPLAATIPAGLPGSAPQVQNTPEVEAAIAQFSRAYNDAVRATVPATSSHSNTFSHQAPSSHHRFSSPQQSVSVGQQPWTGPLASSIPAGLPGSGPVADTPEVAAAKNSFLRNFHQQLSHVQG